MNCTLLNTSTLFGHVPSQRYIGIIILFYFSVWSIILIDWGGLYFIQLCDLKKSGDQRGMFGVQNAYLLYAWHVISKEGTQMRVLLRGPLEVKSARLRELYFAHLILLVQFSAFRW